MTNQFSPTPRSLTAAVALLSAALAMGASVAQPAGDKPKTDKPAGVVTNGSFEDGKDWPTKWSRGKAIEGVEYLWDKAAGHDGKSSVCIKKTSQKYFPIADWTQTFPNTGKTTRLKVSVWVKAQDAHKSIVDVGFTGDDGNSTHQWAVYIGAKDAGAPAATHDWKLYEGVVAVPPKTKTIDLHLQTYGPGAVWFDDVKAEFVPDSTPVTSLEGDAKKK